MFMAELLMCLSLFHWRKHHFSFLFFNMQQELLCMRFLTSYAQNFFNCFYLHFNIFGIHLASSVLRFIRTCTFETPCDRCLLIEIYVRPVTPHYLKEENIDLHRYKNCAWFDYIDKFAFQHSESRSCELKHFFKNQRISVLRFILNELFTSICTGPVQTYLDVLFWGQGISALMIRVGYFVTYIMFDMVIWISNITQQTKNTRE